MRLVTFAEFHVESAIREQTFNDARRALGLVMNRVSRLSLLVGVIFVNALFEVRVQSGEPESPRLLAAKSLHAALSQVDDVRDPGRQIAMTAPAEITYSSESGKQKKKSAMAFLYRNTQQGTLGTAAKVAVIDVPAQSAVCFGLRGDGTKGRLTDARRQLEPWLQTHGTQYEVFGPLRVLGYNSPVVPDAKRFSEVQVPMRSKPPTGPVP